MRFENTRSADSPAKGKLRRIGDDPLRVPAPPACNTTCPPLLVASLARRYRGEFHTYPFGMRVNRQQFAACPSQSAADVEQAGRCQLDVLESTDQTPPDFAQQEVMHGQPADTPVELTGHGFNPRAHAWRRDDAGREFRSAWAERHDVGQYRDATCAVPTRTGRADLVLHVIDVTAQESLDRARAALRGMRDRTWSTRVRRLRGGFLSATGATCAIAAGCDWRLPLRCAVIASHDRPLSTRPWPWLTMSHPYPAW